MTFLRTSLMAGAAALCLTGGAAFAATAYMDDADFVMKASVGNTFEVQSSELALKTSKSPELQAFAKKMIEDHTAALKKLETASSGMAKMELDPAHKGLIETLTEKKGAEFDKAYIAMQVEAHGDTLALLDDYSKTGAKAELKSWASETLSPVQMHRDHILKIQAKM